MPARPITIDRLTDAGEPAGPPGRFGLLSEADTALQPLRLLLGAPRLATTPTGSGRPAILVPGWRAPEASMLPLRQFLRARGHAARPWGLGTNSGDVEELRNQLLGPVREAVEAAGRPINLVGWSLGGVVAREVAREIPEYVHRVVTYGTPVVGGPTHTVGAAAFGADESARIAALQAELDATNPIRVPITAIFTRRDRAVDWRACIDQSSADVRMLEVRSSHVALGFDPDVWSAVAEALAEPGRR